VDERSPEERRTRLKKADSIRRMLAESQANQPIPKREGEQGATVTEDRRQREQMLALSQVLARQVMEKSRVVAGQGREWAFDQSINEYDSLIDWLIDWMLSREEHRAEFVSHL